MSERRAFLLAVIILLQSFCALFFIIDVVRDRGEGLGFADFHLVVEASAAIALAGGIVFLMIELKALYDRMSQMDDGIRAARGEMADLVNSCFRGWQFTPSEHDVAMLLLKGVPNETIAHIRGTAPGTVRAQCSRIYAKAGVDGRAQFISLFMEELLCGLPSAPGVEAESESAAGLVMPSGGAR